MSAAAWQSAVALGSWGSRKFGSFSGREFVGFGLFTWTAIKVWKAERGARNGRNVWPIYLVEQVMCVSWRQTSTRRNTAEDGPVGRCGWLRPATGRWRRRQRRQNHRAAHFPLAFEAAPFGKIQHAPRIGTSQQGRQPAMEAGSQHNVGQVKSAAIAQKQGIALVEHRRHQPENRRRPQAKPQAKTRVLPAFSPFSPPRPDQKPRPCHKRDRGNRGALCSSAPRPTPCRSRSSEWSW